MNKKTNTWKITDIFHNFHMFHHQSTMYPLVNQQFAMENGPFFLVDLPFLKMVLFQFAMLVYQRVSFAKLNNITIFQERYFNDHKSSKCVL